MSHAIPEFIQKVAAAVGVDGEVHVEEYTNDALDYRIYLEPRVRKSWGIGDTEAWVERGRKTGEHQLVFRHIHDWGDAWMCFLKELRATYTQSTYDEDNEEQQPSTPEAAYADMLTNLVEEVSMITSTLDSLRGVE